MELACPAPVGLYERVVLAHGGGGRHAARLVKELFVQRLGVPDAKALHDGAVLTLDGPTAVTTDGFVVNPRFFPGGNLGSLAVFGTVNDLAMCGAEPLAMTVSFVLEEGLLIEELVRIVDAMGAAARSCSITVVAGDTKVVERGRGDGVFVSATGLGRVRSREPITPLRVSVGDVVLVSGPVGEHGVAVLSVREGIALETSVQSDAASVWPAVKALLDAGVAVHCLRDATRGGLATVLHELASAAGVCIELKESSVPVQAPVRDACELWGLDPLYVACEGRFVAVVPASDAERALQTLQSVSVSAGAAQIGVVREQPAATVLLQLETGGRRVLELLSGEQLPRIC